MKRPYISVVVPVYNEVALLRQCLASLQAQKTVRQFEIIVVDNGSTDDSVAIAESQNVRIVHEPIKGVCAARQAGFVAAGGEIIISTDADSVYPDGWLARIEKSFQQQPDLALIVGTYRFSGSRFANVLLSAWESLCLRWHYAFGWQLYVSAANLAFRSALFSGYDPSLGSGGDELYVIQQLRSKGRLLFDVNNPIITSARRLEGRFTATLLSDFTMKYLGAFYLKQSMKRPADFRADNTLNQRWLHLILNATVLGICAVLLILITLTIVNILGGITWQPTIFVGIAALISGHLAYCLFWPNSQLIMPAAWRLHAPDQLVALTFDDGPNQPYTLQIAKIIESYGGRASFFQCGQMIAKDQATTARLAAAGHTIGNHTYDHSFRKLWQPRRLLADILRTNRILTAATGNAPRFFRSPWLTKTPIIVWAIRRAGLQPVAGRFISLQEVRQISGHRMARRCLKRIRPGSIIICHDSRETRGGDRRQTVIAITELCRELADKGYRFVSLDELL